MCGWESRLWVDIWFNFICRCATQADTDPAPTAHIDLLLKAASVWFFWGCASCGQLIWPRSSSAAWCMVHVQVHPKQEERKTDGLQIDSKSPRVLTYLNSRRASSVNPAVTLHTTLEILHKGDRGFHSFWSQIGETEENVQSKQSLAKLIPLLLGLFPCTRYLIPCSIHVWKWLNAVGVYLSPCSSIGGSSTMV